MGILADIVNRKIDNIISRRMEEKQSNPISEEATKYNRIWLDKTAREAGFAISDNEQKVDNILKALNKRDGHCPCGGMTDDFICPCKMMREHGACKCGLYMDFKDIEPKDLKSTGRIKDE